jgi:hypothetical protein
MWERAKELKAERETTVRKTVNGAWDSVCDRLTALTQGMSPEQQQFVNRRANAGFCSVFQGDLAALEDAKEAALEDASEAVSALNTIEEDIRAISGLSKEERNNLRGQACGKFNAMLRENPPIPLPDALETIMNGIRNFASERERALPEQTPEEKSPAPGSTSVSSQEMASIASKKINELAQGMDSETKTAIREDVMAEIRKRKEANSNEFDGDTAEKIGKIVDEVILARRAKQISESGQPIPPPAPSASASAPALSSARPNPAQSNQSVRSTRSVLESAQSGAQNTWSFLNNHKALLGAASMVVFMAPMVSVAFPMVSVILPVVHVLGKALMLMNGAVWGVEIIKAARKTLPAIWAWAKEHPYQAAAATVVAIAVTAAGLYFFFFNGALPPPPPGGGGNGGNGGNPALSGGGGNGGNPPPNTSVNPENTSALSALKYKPVCPPNSRFCKRL